MEELKYLIQNLFKAAPLLLGMLIIGIGKILHKKVNQ